MIHLCHMHQWILDISCDGPKPGFSLVRQYVLAVTWIVQQTLFYSDLTLA